MSVWLDACVLDLRARLKPDDEGSLWLVFLDDPMGEVVVAAAFDQAMASIDDEMTRNLGKLISSVDAPALLVIPRGNGLPLSADHRLWHRLGRSQCYDTAVIDLVVVGRDSYWSAIHAAAASG